MTANGTDYIETSESTLASARQVQPSAMIMSILAPPVHSAVSEWLEQLHIYPSGPDDLGVD